MEIYVCAYMHISFALVTIYFTYVNKFNVSEIWISSQIFFCANKEYGDFDRIKVYSRPPAYRPFLMLALTMERLSTPDQTVHVCGVKPSYLPS